MNTLFKVTSFLLIFTSSLFLSGQNTPLPSSILNSSMYPLGYLDVTVLGIDNSGSTDVTNAINDAIVMARDNRLVCYFPSGTYLISNSIEAMLLSYDHDGNPNNNHLSDRRKPCVLVGECGPNQPVLKLKAGATGFQVPGETTSKAAVIMWASPNQDVTVGGTTIPKGSTDPEDELPGIAFNQIFRNFTIDLNNNPGAVGIRFAGAQGSSMENIKIIATNAYAGMQRMLGQGSGYYNVEVTGGLYGILIEDSYRRLSEYAFLSGMKFINQTEATFGGFVYCPISIVGFYIENAHGKIFKNHPSTRGGLSLIDGVINITGNPSQAAFTFYSDRNFYLRNVDIKGNPNVLGNPNPIVTVNPSTWTKIIELSHCPNGNLTAKNLSECTIDENDFTVKIEVDQMADVDAIMEKHVGPIKDCIDLNNAINVKDAVQMNGPFGAAKGDGVTDDTDALQWAIDNNENVFLPKGDFIVSNTLLLKYNTNLFGIGKVFSNIKAASNWNDADKPILQTINNTDANTRIRDLMIEINPLSNYNLTGIHWQAGRNSIVQNVMLGSSDFGNVNTPAQSLHYGYKINGNGGGKWYNTCAEWHKLRYSTTQQNYRALYVEGTTEPLTFYSLNVERVRTEPQAEIKNAENVTVHYFKAEAGGGSGAGTTQPESIPLKIADSNHINVIGGTGKIELNAGEAMVEIYNCSNSTIAHLKSFESGSVWSTIKSECNSLSNDVNLATYKSCKNVQYVNRYATGNNTGENWENAFIDLQSALSTNNLSCNEAEVWVAEGTYSPGSNRSHTFAIPNEFKVYGGFDGFELNLTERGPDQNPTILSGNIGNLNSSSDNVYHVVSFDNVSINALLDGFIIEQGYANGSSTDNRGGGIFITSNNIGKIYLRNNIVQNNYALLGGGLYNAGNIFLKNNTLRYNQGSYNGSAIFTWGTNSTLNLESGNHVYDHCSTCPSIFYYDAGGEITISGWNCIEN